ncbi:uncharacterized protein LOC110848484 isoform X2 [Folsomia candida]|uniref:uncharacterized protein LOC110848484 isoform X2 n=1 Tax=Folsomia candida TaxID=158441 RepID=UPI001604E57F|nr:uncharacterized protein LOC110848484 isoform X2 [Folsomia candida]
MTRKHRLELNNLNSGLKQLQQKKIDTEKQIGESEMEYAQLSAELSLGLIKEKVVSEGLERLQVDLVNGWDSLTDIRSKMFSVSGRYLGECTKFAQMYNCTEMGSESKRKFLINELEEYRVQKQHLEYDLQKFLSMKAEVDKSEKENRELQQQYRLQEETDRKRENEAYNKLLEAEQWLGQLEKKKSAMDKQLQDEINKLQAKLQKTKQSISYWERRVSENQRMVGFQNPLLSSTSCMVSSATSPGIPFPAPTIRLGNGQSVVTNNKTARVAQYVRPTPQVQNNNQAISKGPSKPNPPKIIQTKLQFSNPMNPPLIRPTKPKFISPLTTSNDRNRPTGGCFKNPVQSIPQNKTVDSDDDPFNDSFSSSQYFSPDPIFPSKTLPQPTLTSLSNNSTASSSSLGLRTFQFKKKAVEGPHISGPTGRSVSVTLGTTPFATFQNSRSILQEKHQ